MTAASPHRCYPDPPVETVPLRGILKGDPIDAGSATSRDLKSTSSVDSECLAVELGRESARNRSGVLELGLEKS